MFTELYERVPALRDVVVSVHCHDDLGVAVANSLAGLQAGCRQVELAEPVDQVVVEARQVGRLEVGLDSFRPERVEQGLDRLVGHRAQQIGDRVRHLPDLAHESCALLDRAGRCGDESGHLLAVPLLRNHWQRGSAG